MNLNENYIAHRRIKDADTGVDYIVGCGPRNAPKGLQSPDIVDLLVEMPTGMKGMEAAFLDAFVQQAKRKHGFNKPRDEEISLRAHELWIERGRPEGSPEVDWLKAERELNRTLNKIQLPEDRTVRISPDVTEAWGCSNMKSAFDWMGTMGFRPNPETRTAAIDFAVHQYI